MIPIPSVRDLHLLKRAALQKLCKAHGIKANTKNQQMIVDLVKKRQQLGYPEEEDDIPVPKALEENEAMKNEPVRKRTRRRKRGSRRWSRKRGSRGSKMDELQVSEESCSSRTISTRSTPAPDSTSDCLIGNVEQSVVDPVSAGSSPVPSPVPKSSPHPSTELVGHQDAPCINATGGRSPIPHSGLGPSECQETISVNQISSGIHSEQMVVDSTTPDEKTPRTMVTKAAVNDSGHGNPEMDDQSGPVPMEATGSEGRQSSPEMTEQLEEKSPELFISTPDFNDSGTKTAEMIESRSPKIANASLDREAENEEMFESEGTANLESEPTVMVGDVEPLGSTEEDTSAASRDEETMLNTTYTINPPEGHLEDPQSVLSESLCKTPKQTDSPLLGTWASSGSSPFCEAESKGVGSPPCDIKALVRARSQLRDSPLVNTWSTTTTKSSIDKENQDSQSDNTRNEMMELLNTRVQERLKDDVTFEKELEKTKEEVNKSKPQPTKGSGRYTKAHAHLFDRMESITSTCERKRKLAKTEQTSTKKTKMDKVSRLPVHKEAKLQVKRNPCVLTKTPRQNLSVPGKKLLSKDKGATKPPFRF